MKRSENASLGKTFAVVLLAFVLAKAAEFRLESAQAGDVQEQGGRTIEAERIVIVDKNGKKRIVLGVGEMHGAHGPRVEFLDEKGRRRLDLGVQTLKMLKSDSRDFHHPFIFLNAPNENPVVSVSAFPDKEGKTSSGFLGVSNGTRSACASLQVRAHSEAEFELGSEDAGGSLTMRVMPKKVAGMLIRDNQGKIRSSIFVNWQNDQSHIEFSDKDGKEIWKRP